LYTDDEGARLLVDGLGLAFEHVATPLNVLAGQNPGWWALGKVLTYSLQEEPFVHIDNDVYLWSALPERLAHADVIAQNPEAFDSSDLFENNYYRPDLMQQSIRAVNGWIPTELSEYTPRSGTPRAACCGIVGGRRVDFLRHYANQVMRMVDHTSNRPVWPILRDKLNLESLNIIFEQHLLVACLDYHKSRAESPYAGVRIEYLFSNFSDATLRAAETGFTHLIGEAKQNAQLLARLENRVRTDFPTYYERCISCWKRSKEQSTVGTQYRGDNA
jgi:hypothetical protein